MLSILYPPIHLVVEEESEQEAAIEVQNVEQDDSTFETDIYFREPYLLTINIKYLKRHCSEFVVVFYGF